MAITNFIPSIWSARLLEHIQRKTVFTQPGVVNRDYEGEIKGVGDKVFIHDVGNITVKDYTKYNAIDTPQQLTDVRRTLEINQAKYFNFFVDDVELAQARPKVMDRAMEKAAAGLKQAADTYVASQYVNAGTIIGQTTPVQVTSPDVAYGLLVDIRKALVKNDAPEGNWWVIVPPEFYAILLKDSRFVDASKAGTDEGLRNGYVGKAVGLNVLESNNIVVSNNVYHIMAGTNLSIAFAEQITKIEAYRPERHFADGVKGLYVFGAAVLYPQLLVCARVTF